MNKRLAVILSIISALSFTAYYRAAESKQTESTNEKSAIFSEITAQSVKAVAFGISNPVSSFAPASPENGRSSKKSADEKARAVPNREPFRKQIPNAVHDAENSPAKFTDVPMPAPTLSFDGVSSDDNAAAYGFRAVPPDPNGDVGPNHFVQTVNILTRIFDKSGVALTPPFKLSSIFSALGTPCSMRNDGDPIALYDALADRWILSQFCNNAPPFRQLIAVSQTADPTGSYFVYEFVMPNFKLNDYPKLGVWTDGYYMSTDEFIGSDYAGTGVFAFDKKKMLKGDPTASYVYFDLASPTTIRYGGLLPSDLDGLNAPPANASEVFVGYEATEYGDATDALRLFNFHADFANPNNSTFTERAESPLAVAPFDPTSPDGRADINEPPPGDALDAQSDRLMYRAAYRNLGNSESIVVNQTVRLTPIEQTYRAGVRVYELSKSNGSFSVREQATIGTTDASRWMGSAAQDYQGNIAVGYSFTSELKNPSILYSGKLANEPAGMFRTEGSLINGTGVQTGSSSRWGDYSQMTPDPSDDCTFWITNEYYTAESQAENPYGWLTRIGKFKFPECVNAPRATITGAVTNAANDAPIANATVTANAVYIRNTNNAGSYGNLTLVPNTYVLTATANGFHPQSVTVTIADGQILTQNFALAPVAVLSADNYQIVSESCAVNNAVEPAETVTLDIALRNTGAISTTNLTAALLSGGGVVNPSPSQSYGSLAANGASVSRPFTFTVSPNLLCGDAITLTLQLNDGAEDLGTITININTGTPRVALQENFDSVVAPNLPNGWTTSSSGAQDVWKTSTAAFQSPPNSAHSAAAGQVGVNELVSPVFRINSADAEITFRNRYDLETTFLRNKLYDGAVLEIKIGYVGRFQDILAAGGAFESGGYDGIIDSCCQNPLAGRLAWSGKSGVNQIPEFVTTRIKLPASAAGKNIQLRWRVGTDTGTSREGQFIDDVSISDGFVCACRNARASRAPIDFDGDGKTDLSVFRPSDNASEPDFYLQDSSDDSFTSAAWGSVGDIAINADYNGDGRTDYAVFRPSTKTWFVLRSSDNTILPLIFGSADDRLTPADYDGDGQADIAVYRPSNNVWYIRQSSDNKIHAIQFGASGDLPVQADFDGDGKIDVAVFRPSNGTWYVQKSSGGIISIKFGQAGDVPVVGDYDGDGRADTVVFRPSNGTWYLLKSREGFSIVQFGFANDKLLQADFDGDGKRDIAVYRQSTGVWYYRKSSDGRFISRQFGTNTDVPLPSIFVP